MSLNNLPTEIILMIARNLSIKELSKVVCTCSGLSNQLIPHLQNLGLQDVGDFTALQWAADFGHLPLVNLALSRKGHEVNAVSRCLDKYTALHLAAMSIRPDPDIVRTIIAHGGEVNKTTKCNYRHTALHLTIICGENNVAIVRALIECGARMDIQDTMKCTPLRLAAIAGQVTIFEELIRLGAKAFEVGGLENMAYTVADIGTVDTLRAIIVAGVDLYAKSLSGKSILKRALLSGNWAVARYLLSLEEGRELVNYSDDDGETPLLFIIGVLDCQGLRSVTRARFEDILKMVLESGADIMARDIYGDTPMHHIVCTGDIKTIGLLISKGFDLTTKGANGETVFHRANSYGSSEVVKYFLELEGGGLDIDAQDDEERTPLHHAVNSPRHAVEKVQLLLEYKANTKLKDRNDNTALFDAIKGRENGVLMAFKHAGIDIDCYARPAEAAGEVGGLQK